LGTQQSTSFWYSGSSLETPFDSTSIQYHDSVLANGQIQFSEELSQTSSPIFDYSNYPTQFSQNQFVVIGTHPSNPEIVVLYDIKNGRNLFAVPNQSHASPQASPQAYDFSASSSPKSPVTKKPGKTTKPNNEVDVKDKAKHSLGICSNCKKHYNNYDRKTTAAHKKVCEVVKKDKKLF